MLTSASVGWMMSEPPVGSSHPGLEQVPDLGLDVELVEQRRGLGVQVHPADQLRIDLAEVLLDLVVELARVDVERVDLGAEEVADDAAREAGLALQQRRRPPDEGLLAVDLLPEREQRVDLPLEVLLGDALGHRPDDHAARVLGQELGDHLAQLGPLLPALDLAAHPDLGGVGHVDQEPAGEGDLRGDPAALGADGLLGDLDGEGLALLEDVLDVRQRRAAGRSRAGGLRRCWRARSVAAAPPIAAAAPTAVASPPARSCARPARLRPGVASGASAAGAIGLGRLLGPRPPRRDPRPRRARAGRRRGGRRSSPGRCRRRPPECPAAPPRPVRGRCRRRCGDGRDGRRAARPDGRLPGWPRGSPAGSR